MADRAAVAQLAGIESHFMDVWGNSHHVSEETQKHLLRSLGYPIDTDAEAEQSQKVLTEEKQSLFPSTRILKANRSCRFQTPGAASWELTDEKGERREGKVERGSITLPPLDYGYYDLKIMRGEEVLNCFVIVAPHDCWLPESARKGKRVWGLSAQLYSLRSDANCGLGDYGDLARLMAMAASRKADIVGVNPLHALFPSEPRHFSPYAPSSRLFLNTLYIDVTAIEGFAACKEAQALWKNAHFQKKLKQAREAELVDYELVSEIKRSLFKPLFEDFKKSGKHEAFEQFCKDCGEWLLQHALFDSLTDYFKESSGRFVPWHEWPEGYRNPQAQNSLAFADAHRDRIDFYSWLQWVADAQLANAQATALKGGMEYGLYRDLAVGSENAGAEIWSDPDSFLTGVATGAPPDEYNPGGQNWGLLAFNPQKLRAKKFEPYRQLLRANMRHCRALRIDHAFGLSRLFLIPQGKPAAEGAYVTFPFEEMLAILKIESHRNECCVIGEDLGTFPPNYKAAAAKAGLLSYKVLYFEREQDSSFKHPDHFEPLALATLSTHDLPTLPGWMQQEDIKEKEQLRIYPSDEIKNRDYQARDRDRPLLQKAVETVGAENRNLHDKAQLYLARTACAIVTLQLDDILGVVKQANIPATTDERPNWRIKLPKTIEQIAEDGAFQKLAADVTAERGKSLIDYPRATYRLQFHKDFTFHDAAKIAPYLKKLGISHVYASPYLQARPGSMHGYDITDHNRLNAELGGEEGYEVFCKALQDQGLKQILDFVPNHMGVGGSDNAWWLGVLEWGRLSPYAGYFDINWEPRYPGDIPKILLPFLGGHYGDVLNNGELQLKFEASEGSFSVWHYNHRFPICPRDYNIVHTDLRPVDNYQEGERLKSDIAGNHGMHAALQKRVDDINQDKEQLHNLLEAQNYRLAFWRVAASDINYRRFFDINDLAGVRVENEDLFKAMHRYVFELFDSGKITGLRIDHIDGLADPAGYCHALKQACGSSLYLTVEKILAAYESLPDDWNIEGTSGYDALNIIGNVFVNPRAEKPMDRAYRHFTDLYLSPEDMVYEAKLLILETALSSELQTLTFMLKQIAGLSRYSRDYPFDMLKQALREILAFFPVYRTYVAQDQISENDMKMVHWAIGKAKKYSQLVDISVYDFIGKLLLMEKEPVRETVANFVRKFQQLSGPVMAKGVEDTVFYRFNRLVSLNEVGGSPMRFGLTVKAFHQLNKTRSQKWPHSMLATATHDTKRGEDMRMRLHVLAERPILWGRHALRWKQFNRSSRTVNDGTAAPTLNDEYFIYQTLLGSWPIELMQQPVKPEVLQNYLKRLEDYFTKAIREAKLHSNWNNPDEEYEGAVLKFVRAILDPTRSNPFLGDFIPFAQYLARVGLMNSLSQTVLKLTLPGIPDIYQGCELWDYSLVDPDNRRPVDYALREKYLEQGGSLAKNLGHWQDGRVKQRLIHILLQHRAQHPELYNHGDYEALALTGAGADKIIAFSRTYDKDRIIVIVPLYLAASIKADAPLPTDIYGQVILGLPDDSYKKKYKNLFDDRYYAPEKPLSEQTGDFPILVLAAST